MSEEKRHTVTLKSSSFGEGYVDVRRWKPPGYGAPQWPTIELEMRSDHWDGYDLSMKTVLARLTARQALALAEELVKQARLDL